MFNFDLQPLITKINEFAFSQKQSQQEIIALLKQTNFLLNQINQKLEKN